MFCPPEVLRLLRRLHGAGHAAFLVGGCVRDHLMGKAPKDWDVVTSAVPDEVEALFPHTIPIGKAFGVMLVVGDDGEYEVATFRGDGEYRDGRRPETVRFTSAEEDVNRRDFTVNALMYDLVEQRVIDYVGGQADLEAGVIRTVGAAEQRFGEDALRLLRAVRFAGRTGFSLEAGTLKAIQRLSATINKVSHERIGEELKRMLTEGAARPSFELLRTTHLLPCVLSEVARMEGVPQPPQFHPEGDVLTHTLLMLEHLDGTVTRSLALRDSPVSGAVTPSPDRAFGSEETRVSHRGEGVELDRPLPRDPSPGDGVAGSATADGPRFLMRPSAEGGIAVLEADDLEALAWAVLLHDVGKPGTLTYSDRIRFNCHDAEGAEIARGILSRLRRPGRMAATACELIARHMKFAHIQKMRQAKRRRFLQDPVFPLHLELHRLDCIGSHGALGHFDFAFDAWHEEAARPRPPESLLTGKDLIAMGYEPGPQMGKMLRVLDDARLEGEVSDGDAARAWVKERYPV